MSYMQLPVLPKGKTINQKFSREKKARARALLGFLEEKARFLGFSRKEARNHHACARASRFSRRKDTKWVFLEKRHEIITTFGFLGKKSLLAKFSS